MSVEQGGPSPAPHPDDRPVAGRPAGPPPDRLVAGARRAPGPGPSGSGTSEFDPRELGAPEDDGLAYGAPAHEAHEAHGTPGAPGAPVQGAHQTPVQGAPGAPFGPPAPPGGAFPASGPPERGGGGGGRRKLIFAGAAVAAVAVAGVAGVLVLRDDGSEPAPGRPRKAAPTAWTREAARQIAAAPGLRYDGTLTVDGRPVQVRLRVTAAGSASGTLTAGAVKADLVAVDGVTYVRAGTAFWRDYAGETAHPDNYAGRWSRAPAAVPGFDVPDVLGPAAIARSIARASATADEQSAGGVRVYRVATGGADYVISAAAPYRVLSVRGGGRGEPRFTAAPLQDPAGLFAELRPRVAALGGAADPRLHFTPGRLRFVNCDQNTAGCTVGVPATLAAPEGRVPAGARAALRATITSKGRSLGTCATSAPVPAGRALTLRCTVAGRAWRTWMRTALDRPGAHPYEAQARVVGEAVPAERVPELLARVDRERTASTGVGGAGRPGTGTPGASAPGAPRQGTAGPGGGSAGPRGKAPAGGAGPDGSDGG